MRPRRLLRSVGVGVILLGAAALALLPPRGLGQEQVGSEAELKKPYSEGQSQFSKLIAGQMPPSGKEDKDVIEVAAKWYTQRLTWAGIRDDAARMAKIHDEFEQIVARATGGTAAKSNRAFVEQFGPALVRSIRPVLDQDLLAGDNRAVLVSAATMLPQMARLKDDAVGTYLAELVKDPKKHDAVRLYAAKGLREYFPARLFVPANDANVKPREAKRAVDRRNLEALVGFVDGSWQPDAKATDPEAVRYLRREALESLSLAQVPAVAAEKGMEKVEAPVAPTLLKVLSGKGVEPPPGIAEKTEAAVGLATMKSAGMDEYQPDVAVYLVGQSVVELANEYKADWVNFAVKAKVRKQPKVAWRVQAKRVDLALKDMVTNTKAVQGNFPQAYANAQKLEAAARSVLDDMQKGEQPNRLNDLRATVNTLRPKSGKVFKTLNSPEIDLE